MERGRFELYDVFIVVVNVADVNYQVYYSCPYRDAYRETI